MSNEAKIRKELDDDPVGIGYSANDAEAADQMNDDTLDSRPVPHITNSELYEATDEDEFEALTDAKKVRYDRLLLLDEISVTSGSRGQDVIKALFAGGTTTRAAVIALASRPRSRAEAIGAYPIPPGVRPDDVTRARAL